MRMEYNGKFKYNIFPRERKHNTLFETEIRETRVFMQKWAKSF